MAEFEKKPRREEIFSRTVRAGKRTYFFDVKATRSNEYYLTITESKRRFNNEQGKFYYEKHKVFLYKEDFQKFISGLKDTIEFIEAGNEPESPAEQPQEKAKPEVSAENPVSQVEFEDLGKEETEKKEEKDIDSQASEQPESVDQSSDQQEGEGEKQ